MRKLVRSDSISVLCVLIAFSIHHLSNSVPEKIFNNGTGSNGHPSKKTVEKIKPQNTGYNLDSIQLIMPAQDPKSKGDTDDLDQETVYIDDENFREKRWLLEPYPVTLEVKRTKHSPDSKKSHDTVGSGWGWGWGWKNPNHGWFSGWPSYPQGWGVSHGWKWPHRVQEPDHDFFNYKKYKKYLKKKKKQQKKTKKLLKKQKKINKKYVKNLQKLNQLEQQYHINAFDSWNFHQNPHH